MMVSRGANGRAVVLSLFVLIIVGIGPISPSFGQTGTPPTGKANKIAASTITYKVIGSTGEGYGYDVFADGKMLIHQPGIPGQPGTKGFRTKADSEKVAQLIVKKLKNKEMPPTVSEEELRKLKVID